MGNKRKKDKASSKAKLETVAAEKSKDVSVRQPSKKRKTDREVEELPDPLLEAALTEPDEAQKAEEAVSQDAQQIANGIAGQRFRNKEKTLLLTSRGIPPR